MEETQDQRQSDVLLAVSQLLSCARVHTENVAAGGVLRS